MAEVPRWRRTVTTRWAWALFAAALALGVLFGQLGIWPASVIAFVAAVGMVPFTKVVVECGPDGLVLRYGPGWPVQRFGLDQIESATAVDLADQTIDRGFWGYKGSVRILGRAQLNLHRGPAIDVALRGGRSFLVTVDDPEQGAHVLNTAVSA